MTVGAVTFDFGGAYAPAFPLPDASGLMPLSLPEEFLHRHESSLPLPQPSSDAVLRFETAMGAEPLASPIVEIKNLVAAGTVPMHVEGTDPMPQTGIIVENSVEKSILTKNPVLLDNPVVEVKVVMPRGTDPVLVMPRGTDPVPKVSSPAQVVGTDPVLVRGTDPVLVDPASKGTVPKPKGTDPVQVMGPVPIASEGTDPRQVVGTDPVTAFAVEKKGEVSGREVPVATKVPIAPNKESYVASVVDTVSMGTGPVFKGTDPMPRGTDPMSRGTDPMPQTGIVAENSADKPALVKIPISSEIPVVEAKVVMPKGTDHNHVVGTDPIPRVTDPVQVVGTDPVSKGTTQVVGTDHKQEVGTDPVTVSAKVPVAPVRESEPASRTVLPTEARLSPEMTRLAPETTVQAPASTRLVAEAKPEIKLEAVPAIDKAGAEDDVVALDVKKAQPLQAAPVAVAADPAGMVDAQSATAREVSAVSAATARTEAVVEVVDKLVEAVVSQITVTPSIIRGEGEVRITLKANVLDGSNITLSAKDGALAVVVTPATPEAAQTVAVAAPRLEVALAEHVPTFRNVVVKLGSVSRKGNSDETA